MTIFSITDITPVGAYCNALKAARENTPAPEAKEKAEAAKAAPSPSLIAKLSHWLAAAVFAGKPREEAF